MRSINTCTHTHTHTHTCAQSNISTNLWWRNIGYGPLIRLSDLLHVSISFQETKVVKPGIVVHGVCFHLLHKVNRTIQMQYNTCTKLTEQQRCKYNNICTKLTEQYRCNTTTPTQMNNTDANTTTLAQSYLNNTDAIQEDLHKVNCTIQMQIQQHVHKINRTIQTQYNTCTKLTE